MLDGKPLICVSADLAPQGDGRELVISQNWTYPEAIRCAGGIPVMACGMCPEEMAQLCDGLLLTGGADVDPKFYGQTPLNDSVIIAPQRDAYEMELFRAFFKLEKPVLGICRGCQLINVALGGTLYQDLPQEMGVQHRDSQLLHAVCAEPDSVLYRLFGAHFMTNSTHHQSVKTAAPGLRITAYASEGVVEGFEHEKLPILATQFHPERLTGIMWDDRTPDFAPFFAEFINLVRSRSGS